MTVIDPVIEYLMTIYSMQGSRRVVSLAKIMAGADRPRKPVLRVLDKLTRDGYLKQVSEATIPNRRREYGPARRNPEWRVIKDLSDRPKSTPRKNTIRDKIWRIIRARRHFTKTDLVITSGAKNSTVDEYVRMLEQHGHIRRTGKDGRLVTYMLVSRSVERPQGMERGSHE
ncbi:MAG TPA: hypothetical protein ENJ30_02050 [Desulfobulbaceae bacterium]|nr:hypothetical protein [Desulfobulbaceae bacterium]